jgi:hypothetical protein
MCIACELGFWSMMDALPPDERERILREQAESNRLSCDVPAPLMHEPAVRQQADDRKSDVTSRE